MGGWGVWVPLSFPCGNLSYFLEEILHLFPFVLPQEEEQAGQFPFPFVLPQEEEQAGQTTVCSSWVWSWALVKAWNALI